MAPEGEETDQPPPLPGDLNPLPIRAATGPVRGPVPSPPSEGDTQESRWGILILALLPVILALALRAAAFGWSPFPIDATNLAYCLFAFLLVGIVRITATSSGSRLIFIILLTCGLIQSGIGLYLAGTFYKPVLAMSQVGGEDKYLAGLVPQHATVVISQKNFDIIQDIINAIYNSPSTPTETAYVLLAGTGIIAAVVVLRYWAPAVRKQVEAS